MMIISFLVVLATLSVVCSLQQKSWKSVDDLLNSMDLAAKIGQMVQLDIQMFTKPSSSEIDYDKLQEHIEKYQIGSILNSPFSGGPVNGDSAWTAKEWREVIKKIQDMATNTKYGIPIIYGIDSIHGATFVEKAALFPQSLNVAASFNTDLARKAGEVTSKDTRASGISWIFSPVLGLGLQPLWARFPETFGEDPHLAAQMGYHMIQGLQTVKDDKSLPRQTAACMKHFIAYSMPLDGHDRAPVQLPDRILRALYTPSFQAAIDAGVLTGMESYQEVGGVPMVSSKDYLKTLLRKQMNFTGFIVTDYAEIENLHNWHKVAATQEEAVKISMQETTIDMSMVPLDTSFYDYMLSLVQNKVIPESRVDESVRRILQVKETLGILNVNGNTDFNIDVDDKIIETVGSAEDWSASLDAARESITLVENAKNILPFTAEKKILLTGPTANSTISLTGGWAIHWQGVFDEAEFYQPYRKSILDGLSDLYTASASRANLQFVPGVGLEDADLSHVDLDQVAALAKDADYIVVCLGEGTYAEKPGDIDDLVLPAGQLQYVHALKQYGKPIVLVMVEGRPRIIKEIVGEVDAVLLAYQPGPLGGQAVAETLLGANVPSGRLPFSYPYHQATVIYQYHHKTSDQCIEVVPPHGANYKNCQVQWPFGHGLSYTNFEYSDLAIDHTTIDENTAFTVRVTVKNSGARAAKHSVLLFLFDMFRRVTPEYKLLKKFQKISLAAGESKVVQFQLHADDLKYVGVDSKYILEDGEVRFGLGESVDCRANENDALCLRAEVKLTPSYRPVCDEACALWSDGICGARVNADNCRETCITQNWSWDYVNCITNYYQESSCTDVKNMQCFDAFKHGYNYVSQAKKSLRAI